MAWLYLFIAAILESAWTFSLKFLNINALKNLPFHQYFEWKGFIILCPLLGYIFFGIANTYFFALALKSIPTATAMAVWTAGALICIKIIEMLFFQEKLNGYEAFFLALITIGIIGLKVVNGK